jgi:hypothetical protein
MKTNAPEGRGTYDEETPVRHDGALLGVGAYCSDYSLR